MFGSAWFETRTQCVQEQILGSTQLVNIIDIKLNLYSGRKKILILYKSNISQVQIFARLETIMS